MNMAKSYYKRIKGVRYDRALIEAAEQRIEGKGDGRISESDLREIIDLSKDVKGVTVTELRTIKYIQDHFRLTDKAKSTLESHLVNLEKETKNTKKQVEQLDLKIKENDTKASSKSNDQVQGSSTKNNLVEDEQKIGKKITSSDAEASNDRENVSLTVTRQDKVPGKSYYRFISGVRYDRSLLEEAEARLEGKGDGRISLKDMKEVVELAKDGQGITETESKTLDYIHEHYHLTAKAEDWFAEQQKTIQKNMRGISKNIIKIKVPSEKTDSIEKNDVLGDNNTNIKKPIQVQSTNFNSKEADLVEKTVKNPSMPMNENETQYPIKEIADDDSENSHGVSLWQHLIWAIGVAVSLFIGWNMYHAQLQIVNDLENKIAEQKSMMTEFEKINSEKEELESQFEALEITFQEQELEKNKFEQKIQILNETTSGSENKMSAKIIQLQKMNNDLSIQQTQLIQKIEESSKNVPSKEINNCCYCSCNSSSFEESLNLNQ